MKTILLFVVILPLSLVAQTKQIAHKMRSGSAATFRHTCESGALANSNFGAAPMRAVRSAVLDSVIYVDQNTQIMVTSERVQWTDDWRIRPLEANDDQHQKASICTAEQDHQWKPGRDTVRNHVLFSLRNVDSIKSILAREFYFQNNIDSVRFVGYPVSRRKNKTTKTLQQGMIDYIPIGIIVVSVAVTLLLSYQNQRKHEH